MALTPGTRLGAYEIVGQIGVGGMGEVWRATDTNLDRQVAIKVLPETVASDPERLARFDREAKTLAALNHPNVAQIYGVERAQGQTALVMELVEGPTLADRIAQGLIPVDEALPIAKQIAEALEAAHERGIIHRDLKPANVKVRPDGTVKVLDFGLAKALDTERASAAAGSASMSPTITTPAMTAAGMILGTAAYMSPEQAKGLPADRRADIFAFGVVLLEMLTGRQAFRGELVTEVIASVITQEPDYSGLPKDLDPRISGLLRRCLAKAPKNRWQAAGDLRFEIEAVMSEPPVPQERVTARSPRSRLAVAAAVVLTAVLAAAAGWLLKPDESVDRSGPVRLAITLPPGQSLNRIGTDFDIAADGTRFTYASNGQLYVRSLSDPDPVAVSGTTGASSPFFSPDGDWIGFFAGGQLKKVAVAGGVPEPLCDVGGLAVGGSWAPDGTIYFAQSSTSGIWKIPAEGGVAEPVTTLDREAGEISHRRPQALPGALLFTAWTGPGFAEKRVELLVLATGERRVVVPGGNTGRYVPSGHIVYSLQGDQTLMAVPFDLESLRTSGPAVRLADAVSASDEGALFALSNSGVLVYVAASPGTYRSRLAWVDRDGRTQLLGPEGPYSMPRLSPDGRFAAVNTWGARQGISIYDFARNVYTPLALGDGSSQFPLWHPDGREIIYRGTRLGSRNLYRRSADGGGDETRLTTGDNVQTAWAFSRDGWLLFGDVGAETGADLWAVRPDEETRQQQPFIVSGAWENLGALSPDGRAVAYASDESGRSEVFIRSFPQGGSRTLVGVGTMPMWSRDGRELFYLSVDGGQLLAAGIGESGPGFEVRSNRVLVQNWPGVSTGPSQTYDASADGRFLTAIPVQPSGPVSEVTVVLNWDQELKRLAPAN